MLLDVVVFDDGGESKVGVLSCVWATKRAPSSEILVAPIALVGNLGMWEIGFLHPCIINGTRFLKVDSETFETGHGPEGLC